MASGLAKSSMGTRHRKQRQREEERRKSGDIRDASHSNGEDSADDRVLKATKQILAFLEEDSEFFGNNPSSLSNLPQFSSADVELGDKLGQGEFGIVSSVKALHDVQQNPRKDSQQQRKHEKAKRKAEKQSVRSQPIFEGIPGTSTASSAPGSEAPGTTGAVNDKRDDKNDNKEINANGNEKVENPQDGHTDDDDEEEEQDVESVAAITAKCGAGCGVKTNTNQAQACGAECGGVVNAVPTAEEPSMGQGSTASPSKTSHIKSSSSSQKQKQHPFPPPQPQSILAHNSGGKHHRPSNSIATRVSFAGLNDLDKDDTEPPAPAALNAKEDPADANDDQQAAPALQPAEERCCESSTISSHEAIEENNALFSLDSDDEEDHDDLLLRGGGGEETEFLKGYMSKHCLRFGKPRYAIKQLRPELKSRAGSKTDDTLLEASIDLACEAKYLSTISHPNIVRIRGIVGQPGTPNFGIIMDCLQMTLADKLEHWNREEEGQMKKRSKLSGLMQRVFRSQNKKSAQSNAVLDDIMSDKLLSIFDVARAMRYLHNNMIVFRDLKPDNVAFDFRGDMRLFDFGLAKELKRADLRNPPDEFNATGLTGSRRYMAPEVVQCKEYGLSADVYSFAILAWEVLSGKSAFEAMDLDKHFDLVVMKGKRPKLGKTMEMKCSKQLLVLLERMWSDDPKQRPLFKSVCEILSSQLAVEKGGASSLDSNRSQYLIARSQRSRGDAMQDDAEKDGN
eukprot:CAMPEP_0119547084 /NCGR_PEP_ID=MMETSP1352-20130426/1304_1 /TAXON_ID=265584 /ORGANISM="Stauroneis constricta, Strain CCMP1120" /LENGTH=735 /DNA_ID=CAMNT_0007591921 /DNA_START=81 /DNA_END=2288 /DNA_ORIENTATION=-